MTKILQILFVALFAIALCGAEAPRSRSYHLQVRRNRLARQEVADAAAVTPYPSADELKPEVPFDETVTDDEPQPIQPDEVYGPPEDGAPAEPNNTVAAEEETANAEEEKTVVEEEDSAPARLTARRTSSLRKSSVRPAKLRKAAPARLQLKSKVVPQPVIYYVAH